MSTILKVDRDGDIRRVQLDGTVSYSTVSSQIKDLWHGCSAHALKYVDGDGAARVLEERTFADFLTTASKGSRGSILRLQLIPSDRVERGSQRQRLQSPSAHAFSHLGDECLQSPLVHNCRASEETVHSDYESFQDSEIGDFSDAEDRFWRVFHMDCDGDDTASEHCQGAQENPVYEGSSDEDAEDLASTATPESSNDPIIDHNLEEQIDIVLAAFDENGDAHLNYEEASALQKAACGATLSREAFEEMCADEGEDPNVGLGRESLIHLYSSCGELKEDFEAAKQKLQGTASEEHSERPYSLAMFFGMAIPLAVLAAKVLQTTCSG